MTERSIRRRTGRNTGIRRLPLLAAAALALGIPRDGRAAQVWLGGVDPVVQQDRKSSDPSDFMALFTPGAPWRVAASHVNVFKVSTQFVHRASDEQLSAVIGDLRRRHIDLAIEGILLVGTDRCGPGVESYAGPGVIAIAADRIAKLGGHLRYVALDEPAWFGHRYAGPRACQDNFADIARQMAPNVAILRSRFPDIQFGDIEPLNSQTGPGWLDQVLEFDRAFAAATGIRMSFVQADLIWQFDWKPQLRDWKQRVHAAGMRFGVIFDGDPGDPTDLIWTAKALERYRAVVATPATIPDQFVFQSWMDRPTRMLPDSDNTTLTSVVRQALGR